jgi:hypothetical protein
MNQHLKHAYELYETQGINFSELLKWHLLNGVVLSLPTCFLLAYFCKSSDIETVVSKDEGDCVFITMCIGDMHEAGKQIIDMAEKIAYKREFKGSSKIRIKNFKEFYRRTKWDQ